uniref:4a-hydroxytetrahydrobiopterin dehydratase n=2 Tax=environmental samples TaxID=68359 RepID=A0A075H885_9EURY|nr:pterin-4-alpha-carbinolamine dehydratase (PCBD, phhB) [uncultured marine group II/III euryarchaeote KM3_46_H05]
MNRMALHEKRCIPCEGGVPPLDDSGREPLLSELNGGWQVVDGHHLERTWSFPDFAEALTFVNAAGAVCEEEFHHADFDFGWGRVKVTIWTHKIDGLTESDFVLAAKLDQI